MSPQLSMIVYAIVGLLVVLWVLHSFIPLPKLIKSILSIAIILFAAYWLLTKLGIIHGPMINNIVMHAKTMI